MPLELSKAIELVTKLDRTRGFPRDPEGLGIRNLATGLQKASDSLKIAGNRIVEKCAELSEYCPTDADLLNVARDLARVDQVATGSFDSLAGAANNVHRAVTECELCHGTGWEVRWYLHTHEGGRSNYVKKERVTEAQAKELEKRVDWKKQFVYSAAKKCTCPVPQQPAKLEPGMQAADFAKKAAGDLE